MLYWYSLKDITYFIQRDASLGFWWPFPNCHIVLHNRLSKKLRLDFIDCHYHCYKYCYCYYIINFNLIYWIFWVYFCQCYGVVPFIWLKHFLNISERNLNPKAACLKRREEEKAEELPGRSAMLPPHPSITPNTVIFIILL